MPRLPKTPTIDQILGPNGRLSQSARLAEFEYRPQQAEMAHAIESAFRNGRPALVEAATGVGKTLGYLVPVVRAAARGAVTVVSTHTIGLQAQLLEKDIPLVASLFPGVKLKAVAMKGRANYVCKQDLDAAEADLFHATDPAFRELKRWVRSTASGDVADLPFAYGAWSEVAANQDTCRQKECHFFESCFYYRMRRAASDANVIVVNHALFLSDLMLRQADDQSAILPDYEYVVIDEAHHIEDVATKTFGIEVTSRTIPHFAERVRRTRNLDINVTRLEALEHENERLFAAFQHDRQEFFFKEALDEPAQAELGNAATAICTTLEGIATELLERAKEQEGGFRDRLQGFARMAARLREELHTVVFGLEENRIRWCARSVSRTRGGGRGAPGREQRMTLHYTPVEVGELLRETLWSSVSAAVLTSATLSNSGGFAYLRARLGLPDDAEERILGSPFDFKRQAMLYCPGHFAEPPKGPVPAFTEAVAREIERIVELSGGRAFLLFTSRRMLNDVFDVLQDRLPYPLFRQGDMPAALLLQAFRESGDGCLFGTQTFWEGVDVQGEALSCVVIDRLPFAVPDSPVTRARTEAIAAAGGDWFREFSIPQAQIRLKQGFGRLIRTRTDRGIVCVLDRRLISREYGAEFVRHLPPARRASIWSRVEQFWNEAPGSAMAVEDTMS